MIEDLLSINDYRGYFLSQNEMERRWNAVREKMQAKSIDFLVIQSQQRYMGGYFLWFTDFAANNFSNTAIFPVDDDMTIISHGPLAPSKPGTPPKWAWRGVEESINVPVFPNVWWQDSMFADKAVEVMMRKKPKVVGLVGLGNMSAALFKNMQDQMKDVEIINATDLVDEIKMIKSEEEIRLLRDAAYLHEMSYDVAKEVIKPGKTVTELIEIIRHAQVLAGSEEQQINITFGPVGGPHFMQRSWGNTCIRRKLKPEDVVNILIESSARGGYWYDLRRFFFIGSAPESLKEAYRIALEARDLLASHLKPGFPASEASKACDEFLKSNGCPAEARVSGHGQGVDLVERPILRAEEPVNIAEGMVVSLHPVARTKEASATIADTYIVTKSGAKPIYKVLFEDNEIIEIN